MKTKLSTIGTLLVLGLMTFNARAIILFQDDFNSYGNGALTNSTWVAGFGNTLNAQISVNGGAALIAGFGSSALPRAYFTNAPAGTPSAPGAPNFPNTFYYFPTNSPTLTLYYSFTLNIGSPPGVSNNTYIAYLTDTNFSFVCRATVLTNNVSSGKYRIGVSPFSASLSLTATNSSGVRFFLGYAQVWCQNVTPESSRLLAVTDPHSPGEFRVNGVLVNSDAFQQAFTCKAGQPMVSSAVCRAW